MPLNIVFMGTPDFAVPCLRQILDSGHTVRAVFSQPDRPKGRGYTLVPPPVKAFALERGLPVYQPEKLRDGDAESLLRELNPDLAVVVAYGRILPPALLAVPPLGCVNVHASLLPALRGAAPIQWSVINGDATSGVSTMYMAEGLDTGDVIQQRETPVGPEETAGELFERLSALGAELLGETLALIERGEAPRTPQDETCATFAPPITKEMARVDFRRPAWELCNLVRGLNPSPTAYALLGEERVKLLQARVAEGFAGQPGAILDKKRLIVGCGEGAIELLRVQPPGKKPMDGAAFANGRRLSENDSFTVLS